MINKILQIVFNIVSFNFLKPAEPVNAILQANAFEILDAIYDFEKEPYIATKHEYKKLNERLIELYGEKAMQLLVNRGLIKSEPFMLYELTKKGRRIAHPRYIQSLRTILAK